MKTFFLIVIALIVPGFFLLMFVQGTYNKLVTLRARARSRLALLEETKRSQVAPTPASDDGHREANRALEAYQEAVGQYEALRRSVPARWVAGIFGFVEMEQHAPDGSASPSGR